MTLSAWTLVLAVFLSGVAIGVLVMLVIGTAEAIAPVAWLMSRARAWMPSPAACWALACVSAAPRAIAATKEHDQCMLLTGVIAPWR